LNDPHRKYEIRCPVHGFIAISDWEREIIAQPAFQRLRRIRQLAWTDQVYPGAMHTRFEHSLGVMHVATMLYQSIWQRSFDVLKNELGYDNIGLERDLKLVRIAALLHDVGHAPFSHAAEELLPEQDSGGKYKHENYSAAIVRTEFREAIEEHTLGMNYGLKAEEVAALLEGSTGAKQRLFWRDLIDGQMDADRMDYLLRDSHHAGVQYGKFDLERIINTVCAIPGSRDRAPRLGVSDAGWHAAVGLVLARYFMFTQVYFHKTRVAFDIHLKGALQELLPGGKFPRPTGHELDEYLHWDDWKVCGLIADGRGGEHSRRLNERNQYRLAYQSPELSTPADLALVESFKNKLGGLLVSEAEAVKSWYKTGAPDIPVINSLDPKTVLPLSKFSSVISNMKPINQVLLYARPEDAEKARDIVKEVAEYERNLQPSLGFDPGAS
jgi:uncharacterized protein